MDDLAQYRIMNLYVLARASSKHVLRVAGYSVSQLKLMRLWLERERWRISGGRCGWWRCGLAGANGRYFIRAISVSKPFLF